MFKVKDQNFKKLKVNSHNKIIILIKMMKEEQKE